MLLPTQQVHMYQLTDTGKVMEHTLHRILEHHQIAQFTITLAPGNNKLITPRSPNIFPFGVRALKELYYE